MVPRLIMCLNHSYDVDWDTWHHPVDYPLIPYIIYYMALAYSFEFAAPIEFKMEISYYLQKSYIVVDTKAPNENSIDLFW